MELPVRTGWLDQRSEQRLESADAMALIVLAAMEPLSFVAPRHRGTVDALTRAGLLMRHRRRIFATGAGLKSIGRVLH